MRLEVISGILETSIQPKRAQRGLLQLLWLCLNWSLNVSSHSQLHIIVLHCSVAPFLFHRKFGGGCAFLTLAGSGTLLYNVHSCLFIAFQEEQLLNISTLIPFVVSNFTPLTGVTCLNDISLAISS